jgi:hypothetical protein
MAMAILLRCCSYRVRYAKVLHMARCCFAIALTLFVGIADAEKWVAVREPSLPDKPLLPAIYVGVDSIEIMHSGLRRARSKVDWFEKRKAGGEGRPPHPHLHGLDKYLRLRHQI